MQQAIQPFATNTLYETYIDVSSEYKIPKIKLNGQSVDEIFNNGPSSLVTLGLVGDYDLCLKGAARFLELSQDQEARCTSFVFDEGILAIRNSEKLVLIYKAQPQVFLKKEFLTEENSLATDYVRYLIDMCPRIMIFVKEDFILNEDMTNPWRELPNPEISFERNQLDSDAKIKVYGLLPAEKESEFLKKEDDLMLYADGSNYIAEKEEMTPNFKTEIVKKEIELKYIQKSTYFSAFRPRVTLAYEAVKERLHKEWPEHFEVVPDYEARLDNIFGKFITNEKRAEFKAFLSDQAKSYQMFCSVLDKECDLQIQMNREKIAKRLINKMRKYFCANVLSRINPDKKIAPCNKECNPAKSWTGPLMDFQFPYISYLKIGNLLSPDDGESPIHFEKRARLSKVFQAGESKLAVSEKKIEKEFAERKKGLLRDCLGVFFKWMDSQRVSDRHYKDVTCRVPIISCNILKYKDPSEFLMKKHLCYIAATFRCDINSHISIPFIHFTNNSSDTCSGFFMAVNAEEDKSILYSFNLTPGAYASAPIKETSFSSAATKVLIDNVSSLIFVWDNATRKASFSKIIKKKISNFPLVNLYGEMPARLKEPVEKILGACFLSSNSSILLLDQNYNLLEFGYYSKTLKAIMKKTNTNGEIENTPLRPQVQEEYYSEIQAFSNGKYIMLRCQSSLDVYSGDWILIYSIPITNNFKKFKLFSDASNAYVIFQDENKIKVSCISGIVNSISYNVTTLGDAKVYEGNPILDVFYLALTKFGPHSKFLKSPRGNNITLLTQMSNFKGKPALEYFEDLGCKSLRFEVKKGVKIDSLNYQDFGLFDEKEDSIDFKDLRFLAETRVPIHCATIENSNIVPLADGKTISHKIQEWVYVKDKDSNLLGAIVNLTNFGVYDRLLETHEKPLKVVSIVGKQSGGKSYVLNRLFGTRFNVSAGRCTDGIWLSMCRIGEQIFVVLDCEGLFSLRRNDQEEVKLYLTLAAISDVMILNQDLSFSRHVTELFNKFQKSMGKLSGKSLFKGNLHVLVRDVDTAANRAAYEQITDNFKYEAEKNQNEFLTKIFQGQMKFRALHYFKEPSFDTEVDMTRQSLVDAPCRWPSGKDFLETLKLTLVQVFADDDTDLDIHKLRISIDNVEREAMLMFEKGESKIANNKRLLNIELEKDGALWKSIEIDQTSISLDEEQTRVIFEAMQELAVGSMSSDEEFQILIRPLKMLYIELAKTGYSELEHNNWLRNLNKFLEELLKDRQAWVLEFAGKSLSGVTEFSHEIRSFILTLTQKIEEEVKKRLICSKTCRKCERVCTKQLDHKSDCSCETDHTCKLQCSSCVDTNQCYKTYGHKGSHKCNKIQHQCQEKCHKPDCVSLCKLEIEHSSDQQHDCLSRHYCEEYCLAHPKCTRKCIYEVEDGHKQHFCGEQKCPFKCELCDAPCIFPNHLHDYHIQNKNNEHLQLHIGFGQMGTINYHTCGKEHPCPVSCQKEGVCRPNFEVISKTWSTDLTEFQYQYLKPKEVIEKCSCILKPYTVTHEGGHGCGRSHRCTHQCPECKSFCRESFGHSGRHSTHTHRNKEENVFVSRENQDQVIEIEEDGNLRAYKVGETAQPENCTSSCMRKGRAHFHIKECKGGDLCEARLHPEYIKHSNDTWYPFTGKVFDLWLCKQYWESLDWNMPVSENDKSEIGLCNYYCDNGEHSPVNSSNELERFCNRSAWHQGSHTFDCLHQQNEDYENIEIVFCCDATDSMDKYIERTRDTIRKIIETVEERAREERRKKRLRFGFVAYRDHPPQCKSYVTKVKDLCSAEEVLKFIEGITGEGGGDLAEAVMDGLNDSIKKISWTNTDKGWFWRSKKNAIKIIIHIADGPPHGKEYGCASDTMKEGCPCKITIEDIAKGLKAGNIQYKLIKIGRYVDEMAKIFRRNIEKFDETELDKAEDLEIQVSNMISRELSSSEIDYKET